MCLNYVEGGGCHVTGAKCLLGFRGATAKNQDYECELHGGFDVWLTESNDLLITDMGFPSQEPKQCLALGIEEKLARKVAGDKAQQLQTSVLTTEHICLECHEKFWVTDHVRQAGLSEIGEGYFCARCMRENNVAEMEKKLGALRYWCG